MEGTKRCSPIPIQDPSGQPLGDIQKAEVLAGHYRHKMASALRSLKAGKSLGPDHIPYEFLTHSPPSFRATLLQLCNISWS
ncbi:hypothetical protein E2C01_039524 [Portunus trituberculatus]|uniref:Uncharacterized protein n=1 Tax=Portunus trituberculatus TaxID=210409 RepID=A0A5B7FLK9_PORTR|nr:hypothetical protein [Portunus trituberculatus]